MARRCTAPQLRAQRVCLELRRFDAEEAVRFLTDKFVVTIWTVVGEQLIGRKTVFVGDADPWPGISSAALASSFASKRAAPAATAINQDHQW